MNNPATQAAWDEGMARLRKAAVALPPKRPDPDRIVRISCEFGCIYYSAVRNLARTARNLGYNVTIEEGDGWLSRPFWITGPWCAIEAMRQMFESWDRDE